MAREFDMDPPILQNNVSLLSWRKRLMMNIRFSIQRKKEVAGPLYFAILISQILSQTEEATLALQLRLK